MSGGGTFHSLMGCLRQELLSACGDESYLDGELRDAERFQEHSVAAQAAWTRIDRAVPAT